jgi:hypothetical protein
MLSHRSHSIMKCIFVSGLLLIIGCAAVWAAYSTGYRSGFDRALILQNGVFVETFGALQKIRAGDVEARTRRIETLCFSAGITVYGGRTESEFVAKTFFDDFTKYRRRNRSNSAEWTVAEQRLDRELAVWIASH